MEWVGQFRRLRHAIGRTFSETCEIASRLFSLRRCAPDNRTLQRRDCRRQFSCRPNPAVDPAALHAPQILPPRSIWQRRTRGSGDRRGISGAERGRTAGILFADALRLANPPKLREFPWTGKPLSKWDFGGTGVSDCVVGSTAIHIPGSNPSRSTRKSARAAAVSPLVKSDDRCDPRRRLRRAVDAEPQGTVARLRVRPDRRRSALQPLPDPRFSLRCRGDPRRCGPTEPSGTRRRARSS